MVAPFLTIFLLPPVPLCELLPVALASASKVQGMSPCACKSWLPLAPAAELHWHHLSNQRETISTPSLMYRDVLLHQVFLPSAGIFSPLRGLSFSVAHRGSLAGILLSGVFPVPDYMVWDTPSCLRVHHHFPLLIGSLFSLLGF